jgi:iron-sulfur cluster repair protein YtfE (RIC family)
MMNNYTETSAEAWERREKLTGRVDFTMMYVAHDAFNRDLARLIDAADRGRGLTTEAVATWKSFSAQLHTHHTAEDTALWPKLYEVATDADEVGILRDMEAEHASLDPRLERVDAAIADRHGVGLPTELKALGTGLSEHMRHEEEAALPLLERRLGVAGWEAFTRQIRDRVGGIKGGAEYLPWVLDGATQATKTKVLRMLPPPARLLYRGVWQPRYRNSGRLA